MGGLLRGGQDCPEATGGGRLAAMRLSVDSSADVRQLLYLLEETGMELTNNSWRINWP